METLSANCPIALPTPGATTREGVSVGAVAFTGVKVFSATRAKDREELGDVITRWLRGNVGIEVVDKVVTQSSDREFHCLTITIFYRERAGD